MVPTEREREGDRERVGGGEREREIEREGERDRETERERGRERRTVEGLEQGRHGHQLEEPHPEDDLRVTRKLQSPETFNPSIAASWPLTCSPTPFTETLPHKRKPTPKMICHSPDRMHHCRET